MNNTFIKIPDKLVKEIMADLEVDEVVARGIALMELKDKQNRRYEQSDSAKATKKRTVKVDEQKKQIVEIIQKALTNAGYNAIITNVSKTVDFEDITVTVTRHRKKK